MGKNILNRLQSELEFPMLWIKRNDVGHLLLSTISCATASADKLVVSLSLKGLLLSPCKNSASKRKRNHLVDNALHMVRK